VTSLSGVVVGKSGGRGKKLSFSDRGDVDALYFNFAEKFLSTRDFQLRSLYS